MSKQPLTDTIRAAINIQLHSLGNQQRELISLQKEMDDEIASVRNSYADKMEGLKVELNQTADAIYHMAQPARAVLCPDEAKEATLQAGKIGWRCDPPKVNVRGIAAVIEALKAAKLKRLLRKKTEINKDAILADPAAISEITGITVSQSERFWAQPFESESEETRLVKAIKTGGARK